jgi:hypothetical protein
MATADNKQLMQHIFTEMAKGNFEPFLRYGNDSGEMGRFDRAALFKGNPDRPLGQWRTDRRL